MTEVFRVIIVDDEQPARMRLSELVAREPDLRLVAVCTDGQQAVEAIQSTPCDIVLLDVQMPELTGFDVVDQVGPEHLPAVIFVTAYDRFAVSAFEANAVDYILKPFDDERFETAIERARVRLRSLSPNANARLAAATAAYRTHVVARKKGVKEIIDAGSIDWVEAADNYVRIHLGGTNRLVRDTMGTMAATLDPKRFLRIHRSTIVNKSRIVSVQLFNKTEFMITLADGTSLPSSRAYRRAVRLFVKEMERRGA